jgi:hypothetical protein
MTEVSVGALGRIPLVGFPKIAQNTGSIQLQGSVLACPFVSVFMVLAVELRALHVASGQV